MPIIKPHHFVEGTPIDPDQMNSNFDTVYSAVNDNEDSLQSLGTVQSLEGTVQSLEGTVQSLGGTVQSLGGTVQGLHDDLEDHKLAENPHGITPGMIGAEQKLGTRIIFAGSNPTDTSIPEVDGLLLQRLPVVMNVGDELYLETVSFTFKRSGGAVYYPLLIAEIDGTPSTPSEDRSIWAGEPADLYSHGHMEVFDPPMKIYTAEKVGWPHGLTFISLRVGSTTYDPPY